MNKPIKIGVTPDHLTVYADTLPEEDTYLRDMFDKYVKFSGLTKHEHRKLIMLYGSKEDMFTFMYDLTPTFDLLIV